MSLDPVLLLTAIHPKGSLFTVSSFGGKEAPWFRFVDSPESAVEVAKDADKLKGREGVYHCVQNLKTRPAKGRGGEVDALNVLCVWADVDAMGYPPLRDVLASLDEEGKHAKNRAWAEASSSERQEALNAALAAIEALPIGPPSALVASGRGWHPYWLLDAPTEDLALVKGVNARIADLLHADNCADLARVLKIPGTRNRKIPSAPEPVSLVKFDGAIRYALADLARVLDAKSIPLGTGSGDRKERPVKPAEPDAPVETEDARVRRAVKYVEKIPGAVEGEGGHGMTWKAAVAVVRGFDLSPDVAYNVLVTAYNPRCQPPWSEKELRHKVDSAATQARVARGYLLRNGEHDLDHDVARARARYSDESVSQMDTVQELYESDDPTDDLAHLAVDDPSGYASAKARLIGKFGTTLKLRDLERVVQPKAREILSKKRSRTSRAEYGSPAAMFPDAGLPPECTMPVHWHADAARGIGREVPTGPEESPRYESVCNAPLFVASRGIDLSTSTELMELTWPRDGAWRRRDLPRGDALSHRELVRAADHGSPINSANAMDVVRYLDAFEHANLTCLKIRYVCSSMGWLRDSKGLVGFMSGSKVIPARTPCPEVTFRPNDVGDAQIVAAIRERGTIDGWLDAVAPAMAYPRAAFCVYASFAPPVLKLLDATNPIIDVCGPTSTGKSTIMRLAASPWGVPDERSAGLIRSANTTRVFVESIAATMNGIPCFLDDTKRITSPEDVVRLIYEFSSGSGKGRGSLKGVARTKVFHSLLFLNGESPVTNLSHDDGTKARVLTFWGPPFGDSTSGSRSMILSVTRGVAANYGHAGPAFIRWLIDHADESATWAKRRTDLTDELSDRAAGDSVAGRLAEHVATVWTVAELLHRAIPLPWSLDHAVLDEAWKAAVTGARAADGPRESMDHVLSWAEARSAHFYGRAPEPRDPIHGRWEEASVTATPFLALLPSSLNEALNSEEFGKEVVRSWADRGWLVTDQGRTTKLLRCGGEPTRMVVIDLTRARKP